MPAGQPNFQSFVNAQEIVPTSIAEALLEANVTADDVDIYGGFRARVVSLTGEDFSEIERIELRACPVGTPGGCDRSFLMFSQGDLFRRRDQTINLSPGLLNFKELFFGNDFVRIELVFFPGITTSRNIEARLEWSAIAFGNVD
ncbi:hypothetical protein [Neolewinella persica]|uniref:hypothetical protein n=1 Tax=Neolewinella persica TaxID=70998 RepID=UPI00035C4769|nr:hypothetical protein [Neolewinella persica]